MCEDVYILGLKYFLFSYLLIICVNDRYSVLAYAA